MELDPLVLALRWVVLAAGVTLVVALVGIGIASRRTWHRRDLPVWRALGFDDATARSWAQRDFGPLQAQAWAAAGFGAGDAARWRHHCSDAALAASWAFGAEAASGEHQPGMLRLGKVQTGDGERAVGVSLPDTFSEMAGPSRYGKTGGHWVVAEESSTLHGGGGDELRAVQERSRRYGLRVTRFSQHEVIPRPGRKAMAMAVWRRRRVSQALHRLVRWGARVGTEVLANIPAPQRPR